MHKFNRSRVIGICCLVVFIYFLVFTDSGASGSEFRANTEAGLARKRHRQHELPLRGELSDEDLTKKTYDELQGILDSQSREKTLKDGHGSNLGREDRNSGNPKPKAREQEQYMVGDKDIPGQDYSGKKKDSYDSKQYGTSHDKVDGSGAGSEAIRKSKDYKGSDERPIVKSDGKTEEDESADPAMDFAREKLAGYLKNPVVIFSKSYCPHSKRAKHLLLEVYSIEPKPTVVELDMLGEHLPSSSSVHEEHSKLTLGKALQNLLGDITGRKTVPNIVVGGTHSIGGNDKIWEMHESGLLAEDIKKLGGRKVIKVDVNDAEDNGKR